MFKKRLLLFLTGILYLFINCNNGDANLPFNTEELINSWVELWNTYDLNLLDKLFVTDSSLTYFSSEKEGAIQGFEAVCEHHAGFGFVEGGKESENKLWVEDLQTSVFEKGAVVTGIWFFRRGTGEKAPVQRGPVTFVYVQKGNEYKLIHLHFANYLDEN